MAGEFRVEVDISDFVRVLRATPRAITRSVELTADDARQGVVAGSPRGSTGRLSRSWHIERRSSRAFDVVAGVFYAKWVSRGRGPVRHKRKRGLSIGPNTVRASASPMRANPFIEEAATTTQRRVHLLAERAFREIGVA